MRGKFWLKLQALGAHGLERGTLRGNEGPSSLRGSLVAILGWEDREITKQ